MKELVIYILACYGLSSIIVYEEVFLRVRNFINRVFPYSILRKIVNCQVCTSFYVGCLLYWLFPVAISNTYLLIVISGIVSLGAVKLINLVLLKFDIDFKFEE